MKNADVLLLSNLVAKINYTSLSPKDGYKVFKFIREVNDAAKKLDEERVDLIKSKLSEEEINDLQSHEQSEKKDAATAKIVPFINELFDQEVTLNINKMSFDSYFELKKENKDILTTQIDVLLENVLWEETE